MIKVAVVGGSGYTGEELLSMLFKRTDIDIVAVTSNKFANHPVSSVFPKFSCFKPLLFTANDHNLISSLDIDLVFLAVPHLTSMDIASIYLGKGIKVIDLSADFRLNDPTVFEKWYGKKHSSAHLLKDAVYGMPELYKGLIEKSNLVAVPGCYPTSVILALAPIIGGSFIDHESIIINSSSGTSGAGQKESLDFSFTELYGNYFAYGNLTHRHTPEIEQELSKLAKREIKVTFLPHLLPSARGIYSSIYISIDSALELADIIAIYESYYKEYPKIVIRDHFVKLANVVKEPILMLGFMIDKRTNRLVITSAIDNLQKGASAQAIESLDIIFGLKSI